MGKPIRYFTPAGLLVIAVLIIALASEPPARAGEAATGVETMTVPLICYRVTETVKASFGEFAEYFSRLGREELDAGADIGRHFTDAGQAKPLGNMVYSPFRLGPMKVEGHTILVRADENNLWLVWDRAKGYQTRRWHFEPAVQGTRITVTMEVELARYGGTELAGRIEESVVMDTFKDLDMLLSRIQAHFDPSIDPEAQAALGLKGEIFEGLIQVHQASIKMKTRPDKVMEWLAEPDRDYLGLGATGEKCPYGRPPQGQLLYCRLESGFGEEGGQTDTFTLIRDKTRGATRRTYFITDGIAGKIDIVVSPRGTGSEVTLRWMVEMPPAGSEQSLEQMLFIASISDKTQNAISAIAAGID